MLEWIETKLNQGTHSEYVETQNGQFGTFQKNHHKAWSVNIDKKQLFSFLGIEPQKSQTAKITNS